jgi:penicillin-binding protein 1C
VLIAWIAWPLPAGLTAPPAATSLTLADRHGLVLRTTRADDGSLMRWVPLGELDPQIIQSFIAFEDRRFFEHHGVDPRAFARAARDALRGGPSISGASTISMQLARILEPSDRTVVGKAQQILWALRLETHLDKQTILEQYLNRVPLGQGARGVPAAVALYFDGSAADVSLGQAALLSGLAHAPSTDNPLVSGARAHARRDLSLSRLLALGYANPQDVARARREPIMTQRGTRPFLAPHFTTRILQWSDTLGPLHGLVQTSLDLGLQAELEGEVRHTVDVLQDRGAAQAAAVVLDNATGQILAWVGSPDFWADTAGQVDMVVSPRQPGSALKPFLYALAFDQGFTPATILADVPRTYLTAIGPSRPRNYDRRFHGPVRAREALASSFNIPAVELADRVGPPELLRTLQLAGFTTLDREPEHYGVGLALGNGDVTLLELANAYRLLANGGNWRPYHWRMDANGVEGDPRRTVSRGAAALVLDILSDPTARVPGFGVETPFDFAFPVAAKTGTSRNFTDNWAVGVTGAFTAAVWVGNFSGQPMKQVSGVTGAGPLLHRSILAIAQRYPPGTLPSPAAAGAVPVRVCRLSGLRETSDCPGMVEWFMPGTEPAEPCTWHGARGTVLPEEFAEWVAQTEPPSTRAEAREFRITSPQQGDVYQIPPGVEPRYATIRFAAQGDRPRGWVVDGRALRSDRWVPVPGRHTIGAISAHGDTAVVRIEVR